MRKTIYFLLLASICITCRKKQERLSSNKTITSFIIKATDNPGSGLTADINGVVSGDTIRLGFLQGTILNNLIPSIVHTGSSLTPNSGAAQNFSQPVQYNVAAQDGSVGHYIVLSSFLSSAKSITAFQFKTADNTGIITADISGEIGKDTIAIIIPSGIALNSLQPFITHTGASISPASGIPQDFSQPVSYSVTAQDGSIKTYIVIAGANVSIYIGSNDKYVYALNAITGKLQWKYLTGSAVNSSPVLDNGVVFVKSDNGSVYALEATTGSLKWAVNTATPSNAGPFVANGVVYVAGGAGTVCALNAGTGAQLWAAKTIGYNIYTSPVVAEGRIYVGDQGHGLYALNAANGSRLWDFDAGIMDGGPAVVNGNVYFGGEIARLIKLDAATGVRKSPITSNQGHSFTSPTINNGIIFNGASDGYLYAVDTSALDSYKWRVASEGALYGVTGSGSFSSPVVDGGIVYAGCRDGSLYAFNAGTGVAKWRFSSSPVMQNVTASNPTVSNGIVYSGSYDNNIYALDALSGAVKWSYKTGGSVYSGPCVVDSRNRVAYPGISGHQQ